MTTLSTHDTKRGEDVRARIGVLSQCPTDWAPVVDRWMLLRPSLLDPVTGLFLLQTAFGVWPEDGAITDDLRGRLHSYAEKAMREGRIGTSWTSPDGAFEAAGHAFLDALFDGAALTDLVARLAPHGRSDALAQKLLQLAGPGVPDVYQGTERWEDSLVDPDNRRPVDWDAADDAHPKQRLVRAALRLRRERPGSFVEARTPRSPRTDRRRTTCSASSAARATGPPMSPRSRRATRSASSAPGLERHARRPR